MIDRRRLLLTAAAGAGLAASGCATSMAAGGDDAALHAILTRWFDEDIERSPESATNLGLDRGDRSVLSSRLSDASESAWREDRTRAIQRDRILRDFATGGLSEAGRINLAIAAFRASGAATGAGFDYGSAVGGGRMGPYLVNQMTGSYFTVPDFLDSQHRVEDRDGAEAFLARLSALAPNLDAETARIRADAGKGVVPPDFVIDLTSGQLRAFASQTPADMAMIRTLERKASALGLSGYGGRAERIVDAEVKPALARQIACSNPCAPARSTRPACAACHRARPSMPTR